MGKMQIFRTKSNLSGAQSIASRYFAEQEENRSNTIGPAPKNVTQLQSFLGMINYYSKFLPDLSSKLKIFYSLLKKGSEWNWSKQCDEMFQQ
jgi:hypothetical protein